MTSTPFHALFNARRSLPVILQDEIAECGHACVAMISHYWGHKLDLHAIRTRYKPSAHGVTLREINRMFEGISFQTRALRVSLSELHLIKGPAVLHWNMNHFVVLKQVKRAHIIIHDPAMGVRHCSMDEVSRSFTGVVLEVEKMHDFKPLKAQAKLSLADLIKTITGVKPFIACLLVLSLCMELLHLLSPLFMQYVTDHVIGSSDRSNLTILAVGFMILMFILAFTETIRSNMVLYLTSHLTEKCSSHVVKHLFRLPLDFFKTRNKGDIQSKVQSIEHIQRIVGTDFINTVLDGLMVTLNLVVMFIYSRALTSIVLAALLLFIITRYLSYQSLQKQTASSIHLHAKTASIFLESLQAITPIKSFLKEGIRFHTWRNGTIDSLNADIRIAKIQTMVHVTNQWLFSLEHMAVIYVGATLVLEHQLSVGMLFAFLAYRQLLVNKSSSLIQHLVDYNLISIQLNRLSDILCQEPEVIQAGIGRIERTQGALSLRHISFQYNPTTSPIFQEVNLEIKAGEKVVIVGPSGCGKSTLLHVMMGLLKPTSGEILIDTTPLHDFGLKNYRELTASVMQDDALLSGSILDNISFFDEEIELDKVYQVAQLACIHETIRQLPMGYETLVGDMGSTLSGGQKQRILLARALYKKPKLLFLDEATSHLDEDNERRINQALASLNITQIIIAHRQETINMADRVIDLRQQVS